MLQVGCCSCKCGGKLYTFGSYKLGVCAKGADIDAVCVVPQNVTKDQFFSIFYNMLERCPEVTSIQVNMIVVMRNINDEEDLDVTFHSFYSVEHPGLN